MPSEAFDALVDLVAQSDALDMPLIERRAAVEEGAKLIELAQDVVVEEVDARGVPSEWVTIRGADTSPVLLYLHGGAYVICSPRTHRRLTSALAREGGVRVLAPDYRLAPEHPFPAAVDDAVAAYAWLLEQGATPGQIAVAGDSAGGGLVVAMLVAARDRGLPMPASVVTISPWADLQVSSDSITSKSADDPMIAPDRLRESAAHYLAGADARTPTASPVFADLTGLPPMLIHVGGREVLLDDARALARRAQACGVEATLEVHDEMIHVWHVFAGLAPEADDGVRRVAQFLRAHFVVDAPLGAPS